ncbi:MAG: hypothetical protein WCS42_14040 [Verrucomicrobiota bacterium]
MKTSSNEQHENDGGEVAGSCHLFLLFGTTNSQLALLILGLYFLSCVFGKQAYDMEENFSLVPLLMVATGLLAGAIFKAGKILKTLHGGEIVMAYFPVSTVRNRRFISFITGIEVSVYTAFHFVQTVA